jgi:cytochrome c oxidase cbb3-type subunit III
MKRWITPMALILMLVAQNTAQAQDMSTTQAFYIVSGFLLVVAILVLAVAIVMLQGLRAFYNKEMLKKANAGEVKTKKKSWWSKLMTKVNAAVPLEEEETVMLDHNYDGIRELDNHLPPWWKWLFYLSIVFAFAYIGVYHVFNTMPLQTEEYEIEMALAEEQRLLRVADQPKSNIDEDNVKFVDEPAALAQGKQIYDMSCAPCHKEDGGGGIGPNLTDQYWIHGGSVVDIFRTIKVGVPEKGMISWESSLTPEKIQNVSSYIMTLSGTTPAAPKEPQGELYVPGPNDKQVSDTTQVAVNN